MSRPLFFADDGKVWWSPDNRRPIRLDQRTVDALFEIFMRASSAELFNMLWDANEAAGGIPYCSPFREVA